MSLPAPPAEPLHVLPPWDPPPLLLVLLSLVALGLLNLWLRRRRRGSAAPAPAPAPAAARAAKGPELELAELMREYLDLEAYREGCHALARMMRRRLEAVTGLEIEEMTSAEIAAAFGSPARGERFPEGRRAGALMRRLADLQFRRREPERGEFAGACKEAAEVLVARRKKGAAR